MEAPLKTLQIGMTASAKHAGGVDRYYFNLLHAARARGIHSEGLVTGHPDGTSTGPYVSTFAGETEAMPMKWLKMRRAAKPLLESSDVVVSHFAPYAYPLIDEIGRKPFVVHFHGPWALEGKAEGGGATSVALKRMIERTVYRRASRVIVLSSAFADIVTSEYGVREDAVRVIPGGVDVARFQPASTRVEARERLGWPTDRPTVVTVRRLVQAKGIENLIKAAVSLRERIPDLFVAVVGSGPLAESLQRQIVDLGLENTVRMVGHVSEHDLPDVYRAADLFVVPTLMLEGFGLVVVEALASGTPVLVTPVGGLPDVVRGLSPSLVLEGTEPTDIARGIANALLGRVEMPSEAACIAYANCFSWDEIARRVQLVYREVAAAKAPASRRTRAGVPALARSFEPRTAPLRDFGLQSQSAYEEDDRRATLPFDLPTSRLLVQR